VASDAGSCERRDRALVTGHRGERLVRRELSAPRRPRATLVTPDVTDVCRH
jgi:hypothetical protein